MPETKVDKLKKLLAELFMFDQADLDFGIYRIMNAKRDEITRFLDNDLLPQVRQTLGELEQADRTAIEAELAKAIEKAKELGAEPDALPKVKELREKLTQKADLEAIENEVFSDLFNFFRRSYNEGDFLSLRRYKEGVYAIPYEGEEVKLHWANADQYYIKTTEYFRDYAFNLSDGRRVHFKLAEADSEQDNNRAVAGQERRFLLRDDNPVVEESGELVIRFDYRPDAEKHKQGNLNSQAAQRILQAEAARNWLAELARKAPTEKNPERTVLDKRLADYTARNTFDYFIHKDLGGFLRRELDFYIKNEVVHLDDIESETAPHLEQYLARVRAIRRIAHKIVDFLAQLENFQKKLWLKKKLVVETNYCITLDRIPEELYPEIAANNAQREEWVRLFAIDELQGNVATPDYSAPLTTDFLKANKYLVLDTRHFGEEFRTRLLHSITDLDVQLGGLLIQSENFQALSLIQASFCERIECIHIDPPYNTQTSGFIYKNDYQHSSWLAMMAERLKLAWRLVSIDGNLLCHIDENEQERLHLLCEELRFPSAGTVVWDKKNPMLGRKGIATQHEYVLWRTQGNGSVYLRNVNQRMILDKAREVVEKLEGVTEGAKQEFSSWIAACPGLSGGERAYRFLDNDGRVYQSASLAAPERRTDQKFFEPLIHPVTGQPCPVPPNGWSRAPETMRGLLAANAVIFGADETAQPRRKIFLTEESQRQVSSVIQDASRGKTDVDKLGLEFPYCHPVSLYVSLLGASTSGRESVALDFFAGSGTTGHAVINLNREDGGHRKYILVEMGEYFDTVLIPRIKKVIYSKDWKEGKPVSREGISHMFKYLRLESYEDTLNNLELERTHDQGELLERHAAVREDYVLRYMLDVESKASLLDLDRFEDPFRYTLNVATGSAGDTRPAAVDLVETFNWLLGLRVKCMNTIEGFRIVEGRNPADERVLVIWRNTRERSNAELDEFFRSKGYNSREKGFALIYVNGDNNLENLRSPDETWKVRLIEEEFKRLMFDVQDA